MNSTLQLFSLFFIFLSLIFSTASSLTMRERHEQWMARHGREYESVIEKDKRFYIFEQNVKYIEDFNNNEGKKSYKLAPNEFTDLTKEEFKARCTRFNGQYPSQTKMSTMSANVTATKFKDTKLNSFKNVDWRERGVVTSVKNQGQCGACWAFVTVATIEGIIKIKVNNLVTFSEQNLIECVKERNHGCDGGNTVDAMSYVKKVGIRLEQAYPYVAKNGQCKSVGPTVTMSGFKRLPRNDIDALLSAVDIQPVAVDIDSDGISRYSSGVYDGGCSKNTTHVVTIVGYRTGDPTGNNYWLVKNSWGESWGEKGYIRIAMNESNCPVTRGFGPIAPIF